MAHGTGYIKTGESAPAQSASERCIQRWAWQLANSKASAAAADQEDLAQSALVSFRRGFGRARLGCVFGLRKRELRIIWSRANREMSP